MARTERSATLTRDLVTGESLWSTGNRPRSRRPRSPSITADVAIIGAGISGAVMAYQLAADHRVVVLDRRSPAAGSTSASTALIQWEIDTSLTELTQRIGEEAARRAYLRSVRAVRDFALIVETENLDCDWVDRKSLYLAGRHHGRRALKAEVEARAALGLPSEFLTGPEVRERFGILRTAAILSEGAAVVDPVRLTQQLLNAAERRGAQIHWPVDVVDVTSNADGVLLTTDGPVVHAKDVIFCTGYEFPKGVATPNGTVVSTWAMATKPNQSMPDWMADMVIWEASVPYLYARTTKDGRLIVGGEDEPSPDAHADPVRLQHKCDLIAGKFARLVPHVSPKIDRCWAGAFGESTDGLPQIAPDPNNPHIWSVIGFGGNGITYSMIASQIVAVALLGKRDPDADLYTP